MVKQSQAAKAELHGLTVKEEEAVHPNGAAQVVVHGGENGLHESDEDVGTWAADHDSRDLVQFEAQGQEFSHLLDANEAQWESWPCAKNLPPGWANCPNSGQMIMDMLPTKVPVFTT